MLYTFRATRPDDRFGLRPTDRVTVDSQHPEYFHIDRQVPADAVLEGLVDGLLDGSLEDELPTRPALEVAELIRAVSGRSRPLEVAQELSGEPPKLELLP